MWNSSKSSVQSVTNNNTFNMQGKLISTLFFCSFFLSLVFASGPAVVDHKLILETEQIRRHLEIRRELERDATPFLENTKMEKTKAEQNKTLKEGKLNPIPSSWMEFLTTFSLFDVFMGIFSLMVLGFGSFYYVWRMNPFVEKVEK